ncbi:MAG: metal-binding protein [Candidatus Aminicenantes bacterium RBG_13_59_9]|jgi:predicted metal-binding protein|nr:MAG: metal-binding protein [Candidatus Aminicenantes bacterium RBG_13_59_9]
MMTKKDLEKLFHKHGFMDFRWIDPKKIVVGQWVRLKCMFGCDGYGKTATCPPNVPSVAECERFFREYRRAAVFHLAKKVAKPEARFAWTRGVSRKLRKLEREVFLSGHVKAFLLVMDSCNICSACSDALETCKQPRLARPTPEAMAMDVFTTVRSLGYPIEVLSRYDQTMNRYAFLLVD